MTALTIRPLVATDRTGWNPLWQGYLTFYKATLPAGTDDVTFARLTGGVEPMGGFVAERDGQLIGIVHWVTHPPHHLARGRCLLSAGSVHRARGARHRCRARADRGGAADGAGQGVFSRLLADA